MATTSFGFRYGALRGLLSAVGMGPGLSSVVLDGDVLHVRMGWAFRASIPVHQIVWVAAAPGAGGRHRGARLAGQLARERHHHGLVTIAVDPAVRGLGRGHPHPSPRARRQPRRPRRLGGRARAVTPRPIGATGGSVQPGGRATGRSVQLGEGLAQVAHGLADALFVLDQGEADVAVTAGPEPDAG